MQSNKSSNSKAKKAALNQLKTEVASELGISLKAYNGEISSRDAGRIGGGMTKKVIDQMEKGMGN
ncbi:alpha/beta-type small acid-soluble spore protein [Eubacteriales bacterium OttesenSCG-928-M02]|nr:alpha/beta-type small acid-soluble spore protein [Eubacteriales bacterium OttesenSCG-928-M02]